MKESIRYKNSIIQFVQNFKPPSKKGKSDDSSSVGTAQSLELQEDQDLGELRFRQQRRHKKPLQKINVSSSLFKSLGDSGEAVAAASQVEGIAPSESIKEKEKEKAKAKRPPSLKGKKPTINTSLLVLPPSDPSVVSAKPVKQSKKKININFSKLPLFGEQKDSDEEANLTDIAEEVEQDKEDE